MHTRAFSYHLPKERIAQRPAATRVDSRLLVCENGKRTDTVFADIGTWLHAGDVLVMNDTRVLPARCNVKKTSGGAIEVLLERICDTYTCLCQFRARKGVSIGTVLSVTNDVTMTVIRKEENFWVVRTSIAVTDVFTRYGTMPLPPYITRPADAIDTVRYQTTYAAHDGAVAAPTAGLHFDTDLLTALRAQGISVCKVTLHVGAGTFTPIRSADIDSHTMHSERICISQETADVLNRAKAQKRRIIAVGTTAVRTIESVWRLFGRIEAYRGETTLYIRPGDRFFVTDGLITNFHAPESTLLVLVAAFMGYTSMRAAYDYALACQYRFLSYGDAMCIFPSPNTI